MRVDILYLLDINMKDIGDSPVNENENYILERGLCESC